MANPTTFPAKIPELTGIRGVAACWVLLFHIWLVSGSPNVSVWRFDLTPLFSCGWAGVDLFFVLSGFALTWPQTYRRFGRLDYADFLRRRVLRVVPAYYGQFLFLMLLAAGGMTAQLPTIGNVLAHLLFIHNLDYRWSTPLPGTNTWWTLPIEWQFYLLFPLLLLALIRFGAVRVLLTTALLVVAWRVGAMHWIQGHSPDAPIDYKVWLIEQLPGRIDQFLVGMIAALLASRAWSLQNQKLRERISGALILVGFAAVAVLVVILWPLAQAYWQGHWLLYTWHLLVAAPLAAIIAGAAMGGRLSKIFFGTRLTLGLGEISYSMYLWNYVVLLGLLRFGFFDGLREDTRLAWITLYSIGPVILVSTVSWWVTERPFLHYRDQDPQSVVGRHIGKIILFPWKAVALAALSILALLIAAQWYWRPTAATLAECSERGAIDSPVSIDATSDPIRISGWVYDWDRTDRVKRVVVLLESRIVAEGIPGVERHDVAMALASCRVGKPGFNLDLPPLELSIPKTTLSIEAERTSGRRYRIGTIDWRFGPPRVSLDHAAPPSPTGSNQIIGWAWHPSGPVVVRWLQGEHILAKTVADGNRDDVAKAYSRWPGAARSGFGITARFDELPRESSNTKLEFIAPDGQRKVLEGPLIQNDGPIGTVVAAGDRRFVNPRRVPMTAWAYDEHGIDSAMISTELGISLGELPRIRTVTALPGLFTDHRGIPKGDFWKDILQRGTLFAGALSVESLPQGIHRLVTHVRDTQGREARFPGPLVSIGMPALPASCPGKPFTVYLWATTEMLRKGLPDLAEFRRMAEGGCIRFGIHVRVEYLRTTKGRQADFLFDPDFPDRHRFREGKEMTTTSLREALAMAERYAVPMRILLDGGVWASAYFSTPEFDVADWLKEDDHNVQWNQFGRAEEGDALKGLAGSHDNPKLARVLSLDIYNQQYRHYKKRNLQAAIRLIAQYNAKHGSRPISVTFDPDLYINPWFYLKQWYDYNPNTLRQFREWLTHAGPYASGGELAGSGYKNRLDLSALNGIARTSWSRLDEVDPPRGTPNYDDPWHQIWTVFKRHLVSQHYADLARWAVDAGLPSNLIFTAQTFIQADVSVTGNDRASGWTDEAGVSIAGAKPPLGRLGAILYGPASRNFGTPRSGTSLFADIRDTDPGWEVAEMNPADIESPKRLPSHLEAYQTLMSIFNYGAGGMSPMWTGIAGDLSVRPGQFRSYDTLVQSPFETQLVVFLREAARLPRGSQLWTFGNAYVASDDGFSAMEGSNIRVLPGAIEVSSNPDTSRGSFAAISRPLEGWQVPERTCLRLRSEHDARGLLEVRSAGSDALKEHWQTSKGEALVSLSPLAGRRLDRMDVIFENAPVKLQELILGPC